MAEGTSETVRASTVPPSASVSWASSDETVATVNNGTVYAVAVGNAVITGSFEYEGTVYSDTCNVDVQPVPPLSVEITTTNYWNNPDNWVQREYLATDRRTYITHNESLYNGIVELHYEPDNTSQSTLYLDCRLSVGDIVIDPNKDYQLIIGYSNEDAIEATISLTNAAANMFNAGGIVYDLPDSSDSFNIPLTYSGGTERLFTIQVKDKGTSGNVSKLANMYIVFEEM